jgi:hypothetical protein
VSMSRALPYRVQQHTRRALSGLRRALEREVHCYIAVRTAENEEAGGFDEVTSSPFVIDATSVARKITYRRVSVSCRVRWESTLDQDNQVLSGTIKEGLATIYVSPEQSGWLLLTMNHEENYCIVDGLRMKVSSGPRPEGMGQVVEYSYTLQMYSRDGTYSPDDGGTPPGS